MNVALSLKQSGSGRDGALKFYHLISSLLVLDQKILLLFPNIALARLVRYVCSLTVHLQNGLIVRIL